MNQLYYECDEPIIDSGDEEAFVFNNKVLEELIRNIYLKEVDRKSTRLNSSHNA